MVWAITSVDYDKDQHNTSSKSHPELLDHSNLLLMVVDSASKALSTSSLTMETRSEMACSADILRIVRWSRRWISECDGGASISDDDADSVAADIGGFGAETKEVGHCRDDDRDGGELVMLQNSRISR